MTGNARIKLKHNIFFIASALTVIFGILVRSTEKLTEQLVKKMEINQ